MNYQDLFDQFSSKRVLVIGDVMVDAYLMGKVNRMSPEAPVPVVDLFEKDERIGGAGNVALNLAALGASPIICSVIGKDAEGERLIHLTKRTSLQMVFTHLPIDEQQLKRVSFRIINNYCVSIQKTPRSSIPRKKRNF